MKRKLLIISMVLFCFLFSGCANKNEKGILEKIKKNLKNNYGYNIKGTLEIQNNDDIYTYDVDVAFKKDDLFKVSLKNQINNHEQIILKNNDGVYVLTPSLNKSFKFQSEWPYNNSQAYLIQTLVKDIENDPDKKFEETNEDAVYTVKANYTNNRELTNQKIYFDKNNNLKLVEVMNDQNKVLMKFKVTDIDMNKNYNDDYFTLKENMTEVLENQDTVSKIEDIVYPMYIPVNTYLSDQNQVDKENGERIIMTFSGDKPFMLIQETVSKEENMTITPMYGDPELLSGTIGAISDSSVTWISEGIEYYVASDALDITELVEVAKSIGVMPVGK